MKNNALITLEGSRLQPQDAPSTSKQQPGWSWVSEYPPNTQPLLYLMVTWSGAHAPKVLLWWHHNVTSWFYAPPDFVQCEQDDVAADMPHDMSECVAIENLWKISNTMAVICDSHIPSHTGMHQHDMQCHTLPHLFGSAVVTGAFNCFINPLEYKCKCLWNQ